MPHIPLPDLPGISALLAFRADTAAPLMQLAEVLLRGPSTLSRGERELIAAYVSRRNACGFCAGSHAAFAAAQLDGGAAAVESACTAPEASAVSPKMKALLRIAGHVQVSGRDVTAADVAAARAAGATDLEIHDAVLIAAAFCMYNRYVDGLATVAPADPAAYAIMARVIVEQGYVRPP